jgi:hypothetical protein
MRVGPGEAFNNLFSGESAHGGQSDARHEPDTWVIVDDGFPAADHPPGSFHNPFIPQTWDDAHALPSGAHFYDHAGTLRVRD